MKTKFLILVAIAAVLLLPLAAQADLYGFTKITNNSNMSVATQLSVEVTAGVGTTVNFKFYDNVGIPSSITDIYFDDGTLLGIASISDSGAGVAFAAPATPGNLPGGDLASPAFVTTANFSADSDSPIMANGVNAATEWVMITFDLIDGKTFNDTLEALNSGALRIGLHVQAIGTDRRSDSYVNTTDFPLPTPPSALLLGSGLLGLGLIGWRRREKKS